MLKEEAETSSFYVGGRGDGEKKFQDWLPLQVLGNSLHIIVEYWSNKEVTLSGK